MAVIFLYLLCVKQTTDEVKQSDFIRYKRADDITVFLMGIVILFLNFRLGTAGRLSATFIRRMEKRKTLLCKNHKIVL